ncbi:MAG: type II toxin-antitoxin system VapC family toxin [Euzebyaceae bacterium]|nr:type II toxin-antitoxin system VapC family toxin [Euzebyaceae bacterium]
MIFVDSNIPMYLIGASHPNKLAAQRRLEALISAGEALVTDAEVLQEILHRYHAISRVDAIQSAFDALLGVVDEVLPVHLVDIGRAKEIVMGASRLSARAALHVAIMEANGIRRILTFDAGFDAQPGLERLS